MSATVHMVSRFQEFIKAISNSWCATIFSACSCPEMIWSLADSLRRISKRKTISPHEQRSMDCKILALELTTYLIKLIKKEFMKMLRQFQPALAVTLTSSIVLGLSLHTQAVCQCHAGHCKRKIWRGLP
ncbi:hypothetical protein [Acinetobacter sp. RF14B]|uniref:hypothetical protein n=1 Tax=Acinetobacter sp. RF14B TaxID=2650965 RepID=UPI0011728560|nr:hypothetical protein [Acinetobacter sp. RF14B]TQR63463.1 hypothetical protein E2K52_07850 [Acinetobacter sp. RF14B]